jgi:hypothetical protein
MSPLLSRLKRCLTGITPGRLLDRIQVPLLIGSLYFLCFILGSTAAYFKWAPYRSVEEAIIGGKAWYQSRKENAQAPERKKTVLESMQQPKISWQRYQAFNGYTLIIPRYSSHLYLVDMKGNIAHRWNVPFEKAWPRPYHIKHPVPKWRTFPESAILMPNGDIVVQYTGQTDTPYGYGVARFNKDSALQWVYDKRAHHALYHDRYTDQIYALVHDFRKKPIKGMEKLPRPVLEDEIAIISSEGKELDTISIPEAFRGTPFEQFLFHVPPVPGAAWDLTHANSIDKLSVFIADKFPMFNVGDLLVSLRDPSVIAVINPTSKKVVWATKGPWKFQHDASFLSNGHILMMDNLGCYTFQRFCSRTLEYNPSTGGIEWIYPSPHAAPKDRFLNVVLGQAQRLPNGNTLISKPYDAALIEVSQSGLVAWRYHITSYIQNKQRRQSEYYLRNHHKDQYPREFLSNTESDIDNVLIFSRRYSGADLPFLSATGKHLPQ